jgi:hypothetical protein
VPISTRENGHILPDRILRHSWIAKIIVTYKNYFQ